MKTEENKDEHVHRYAVRGGKVKKFEKERDNEIERVNL